MQISTLQRWLTLASAVVVTLAHASWVMATGPHTQTVNLPANFLGNTTFDGVVRVLAQDNMGNTRFNGTGTIIGNRNVDGQGWLCVLTADHVVSINGTLNGRRDRQLGIAFGNSANNNGTSAYTLAHTNVRRHGSNGTSDIALLGVNYGAYNANYDALVRELFDFGDNPAAFSDFSVIGYGNEGQLTDLVNNATGAVGADGNNDGYLSQGRYGTQRYTTNETVNAFVANLVAGTYTYDAVRWIVQDPTVTNGTGTTFDGDSGSPYFISSPEEDTTNNLFYFTNKQFAVHTLGQTIPLGGSLYSHYVPVGVAPNQIPPTVNSGVYLSPAQIAWIQQECMTATPEPTTLLLLAPGMLILLRRRSVNH